MSFATTRRRTLVSLLVGAAASAALGAAAVAAVRAVEPDDMSLGARSAPVTVARIEGYASLDALAAAMPKQAGRR